jgi:hypothetical protein
MPYSFSFETPNEFGEEISVLEKRSLNLKSVTFCTVNKTVIDAGYH